MILYGKEEIKSRLDGAAAQNRLSHAVMFSGRRGAGKKTMARYLAQLFLCGGRKACGECAACGNIERDEHPDVIFVKRQLGGKYAMEPLRVILRDTVIRPNNGDIKIYVFEDCDSMRTEHFNALLKLIEEPAAHLRFVFTCENTNMIPATVMSRVTRYEVPDTDIVECVRFLTDNGVDFAEARRTAERFSGNIGECKAFDADADADAEARAAEIAEAAAKALAERSPYKTLAALCEAKTKTELTAVTEYLSEILRDALAVRSGGEAEYSDRAAAERIAANYNERELLTMLDRAFEITSNDIYNLNAKLTAAYFTSVFAG